MALFPFAQFDVAGRLGIEDGRYLLRDHDGDAEDVLVFTTLGAGRRGRRKRGRHARRAGETGEPEPLPLTRATVVRARPFEAGGDAEAWLDELVRDPAGRDEFAAGALALVNRALHAQRVATLDPYVAEISALTPVATRIGFGEGEELAAGRWTKAVDAPPDPGRRRRRAEALRPQERLGAVLGGRDRTQPSETLVLRARLDWDHGRRREAALQAEPAARALIAELSDAPEDEQAEDVARLRELVEPLGRAAGDALGGEPAESAAEAVAEALTLCERLLRRRRILGGTQ